jgi:hypothetical protein
MGGQISARSPIVFKLVLQRMNARCAEQTEYKRTIEARKAKAERTWRMSLSFETAGGQHATAKLPVS